jgi:uncharacterized cupredoxin-like copper-binding protein
MMRAVPVVRILGLAAAASLALWTGPAASSPLVIRVEMKEFAFRPSLIRLSVGVPAVIDLVNKGQIAHQFDAPVLRRTPVTATGGGLRVEATGAEFVRVQPGQTARVSFVLRAPGRFPFSCSIEGHAEAGMVGVLEVR